jgi:hypothetical protein
MYDNQKFYLFSLKPAQDNAPWMPLKKAPHRLVFNYRIAMVRNSEMRRIVTKLKLPVNLSTIIH